MAEFAQLPLDAPMPPARVHSCEPEDECFHLRRDGGTTTPLRPPVGPLAPNQLAVPLQDRVGLEQEQVPVELTALPSGKPGERGGQLTAQF